MYVQTGGTFRHHADDFKIADSSGGTGVANVSGGWLSVADGFSIADNAGGTGTLNLSGKDAQINIANTFTMDESSLGNENKIVANLVTDGITTINVGSTASIERGSLEVESDAGTYKPTAGDQYVLIDATGGWDGADDFASVSINVTLDDEGNDIVLHGSGFSGAGGSVNKYEIRVTARGDFDADFQVDNSDLDTWESNFGSVSGSYAEGDADGDNDVDGNDFLMWQRNFGAVVSASGSLSTSAIPEPAGITIILLSLIAGLFSRIRRR